MIKADFHVHSSVSIDSKASMEGSVVVAIEKGLEMICFTDHLDIINPYIVWKQGYKHIEAVRKKYGGQIEILHGMEIEITEDLTQAEKYIASDNMDYILGSTHSLPNTEDFFGMNYDSQEMCDDLAVRYLDETIRLAECDLSDCIAHIGYINRYMARYGFQVDLSKYTDRLEHIFKTLIKNNRGIEINTSGIRQEFGKSFPGIGLIKMYRDLGGEIITVGSDAHFSKHVGSDFGEVEQLLAQAGFKYYTVFRGRVAEFVKL